MRRSITGVAELHESLIYEAELLDSIIVETYVDKANNKEIKDIIIHFKSGRVKNFSFVVDK